MNIKLTGLSQGLVFGKGREMVNFLDFEKEDGSTFRLQVPEETIQKLLAEVLVEEKLEEEPQAPDHEPDASVFGDAEAPMPPPEDEEGITFPDTEEDIPSL